MLARSQRPEEVGEWSAVQVQRVMEYLDRMSTGLKATYGVREFTVPLPDSFNRCWWMIIFK